MNALENICQIYMIQAGFGVAEVVGTLELLKKKIMDRTFLRRLAKIRKKQEEEWAKKRVEAEAEEKLKIVTPDGFDIRDKD